MKITLLNTPAWDFISLEVGWLFLKIALLEMKPN